MDYDAKTHLGKSTTCLNKLDSADDLNTSISITAGNSNDKSQDKMVTFLLPFTLTTDYVPTDICAWKEELFQLPQNSIPHIHPLSPHLHGQI